MSNESDALLVARWCWPGRPWREIPEDAPDRFSSFLQRDYSLLYFYADDLNDIARAERVLIERGLGERYGNALCRLTVQSERYPETSVGEWAATLATAPLDVRVRAMAATIRAHSPLTTPSPPR